MCDQRLRAQCFMCVCVAAVVTVVAAAAACTRLRVAARHLLPDTSSHTSTSKLNVKVKRNTDSTQVT